MDTFIQNVVALHPFRFFASIISVVMGMWVLNYGAIGEKFGHQKGRIWGSVIACFALMVLGVVIYPFMHK